MDNPRVKEAIAELEGKIHVLPSPDVSITISHSYGRVYVRGIDVAGAKTLMDVARTVHDAINDIEMEIIETLAKQYKVWPDEQSA